MPDIYSVQKQTLVSTEEGDARCESPKWASSQLTLFSLRTQNPPDVMRRVCAQWQHGMQCLSRRGFSKAAAGGAFFADSSWCFTPQTNQKYLPFLGPRVVRWWASPLAITCHATAWTDSYTSFYPTLPHRMHLSLRDSANLVSQVCSEQKE